MHNSLALTLTFGLLGTAWWLSAAEAPSSTTLLDKARKLQEKGNFLDAYQQFRALAVAEKTPAAEAAEAVERGSACLHQLGRLNELDAYWEDSVAAHPKAWQVLAKAAWQYLSFVHMGEIKGGQFHRGNQQGGGRVVGTWDRDRVRALQLFLQALPDAQQNATPTERGRFLLDFANAQQHGAGRHQSWMLQLLTDLAVLPDYDDDPWGWRGQETKGAPVDAEGNPVLYGVPKSFAEARNDGERWRWLLVESVEADIKLQNEVESTFAHFLHQQFGVQTMAGYGSPSGDDDADSKTGPFSVHTLKDNETIARLATGIKRFTLADEFNPLKLFQQIAARNKDQYVASAADMVAQIYEDRRQYPAAAVAWKAALDKHGDENHRKNRWQQIVGNWGQFETVKVQPAGQGAIVDFRYRNAKRVTFTAHAIRVDQLLNDVKAYLRGSPNQLNWQQLNISDIGYRLVVENQTKYLGEKTAEWSLALEPRPNHVDRQISVTTPLQKAGAYLLTARLADGNTTRIVIWSADTAIVKKQLDGKAWYYVGDASTGQPIAKANVEFFGWRQEQVRPNQNTYRVLIKNFSEFSSADGQVLLDDKQLPSDYQWLVTARTNQGRMAYLGFQHVWYGQYHDADYHEVKVYAITDRPVYRPEQTVKYKFWIQQAKYDQPDQAAFAQTEFPLHIYNPQGEKIVEKTVLTDKFGGFEGELPLPKGAMLGVYRLDIPNRGSGTFRVEEYKKPEFEVNVEAPSEPLALGEKVTAKMNAKYYFGAPVTHAKVKYKIERTIHSARWYPPGPWDWFYGPGYWWFAADYNWYPGFRSWGCFRPIPPWWGQSHQPPELVASQEVDIGPDGTFAVEIDTLPAKELHGDEDHRYQITAEVTDESRRTIVGSGQVLLARQPFRVYAWVDRGHYRVGDTVQASLAAYTLDQKPVVGKGQLTLYSIKYDAKSQPVETAVQTWDLNTDEAGQAAQQIVASTAGQYRLSYKLTDATNHTIEGAYVFVVRGEGFDGREFRFNDIELIADKKEYAPGETMRLMINTNRADAAVVLFARPANGIYLPPQVLRLKGKSAIAEVPIVQKDMPNFFIEAFTIAGGRYEAELKEIVVPPEKRVLNVAVEPSQTEYQPGAPASVKVTLTDAQGKPFIGSTVLSVYDKSVDYIAGGSNVPAIRDFFWKWRRSHHPQRETNLDVQTYQLLKPNEIGMAMLGVFGGLDGPEDRLEELADRKERGGRDGAMPRKAMSMRGAMGGMGGGAGGMPAPAAAAPMSESLALDSAAEVLSAGPANTAATAVRQNFADTAYWAAALTTDADGVATVSFDMPENLTGWRVKAWAMGLGTKVGEGSADVVTKKNLLVRLQAPRFFVETDEVVLSANIHNYLDSAKPVKAVLELDGGLLESLTPAETMVEVAAGGELRVDWRVKVLKEGTAIVRMKALTDIESDATQQSFPVYVHGMLKQESFSGALRPNEQAGSVKLNVPEQRRINESRLEARFSPTLAGAMVDALPYLVDYPYGCTEQTLNRFLPTVVTQRILQRMQLDLAAIRDKRTNLNAQQIGDPAQRAAQWKRLDRNPVFDVEEVARMVKDGVERLQSMQLSDGGWGWFSGFGEHSYPHTTAVVVHGLQIAQQNDIALVPGMLDRGFEWLKNYQNEQVRRLKNGVPEKKVDPWKSQCDATDALVYMILVDADVANADMLTFLDRDRVQLPVYAKALFGLALQKQKETDKLADVLQNIEQFLVQDNENQTAYLKLPENNWWWSWSGSGIEANASYLKLLTRVNPQDPRCSRLVKYLLNNRRNATYWNSTRDTAYCIEALAEYLVASGEDKPDLTVEVLLDGKVQKTVTVNAENLFSFDNTFVVEGDAVTTGEHTLEFRKQGQGPLYYNVYLTNFTLEDFITKAGLEVKVERKFWKLTPKDKTVAVAGSSGQAVQQKTEAFDRTELANLAELTSGDQVEVELLIDSKNDYEYLIFEDLKASGTEPVDLRSGYNGNPLGAFVEFRDERVCFFVRSLPRGEHAVTYRLRAEIPGQFSALPTRAAAMYAPELKANSDEMKLKIVDK